MYRDREDAGRQLASALLHLRGQRPLLVYALPRGGVVVGAEVARALDAPLDVLVVRKLGAPLNPEFGFGAIAPGNEIFLDELTVRYLGLSRQTIERIAEQEAVELERRLQRYRGDRPPPDLQGRTVILVDDGLATGVTARAAIRHARRHAPRWLVLAVPVAPVETVEALRHEVDELVCPLVRPDFHGLSEWYLTFGQTTDEEVLARLEQARARLDHDG